MICINAQSLAHDLLATPSDKVLLRLKALAKQRKPDVDRILIQLMAHRDVSLREQILDALWEFGSLETARKAARIGLAAKNPFIRDTSAEMLQQVGTQSDVPELIRVLRADKYWVARASAASSLGEHRTKEGIAALERAVAKDRWWCVRAYAANALCRTGDKRFLALIELRIKKDPERAVLPSLYQAMVTMGQRQYVDRIIDLLFEDRYWYMVYLRACIELREIFIEQGKRLPDHAVKGLRQVFSYDVGKAAKWAARDLLRDAGLRAPKVA